MVANGSGDAKWDLVFQALVEGTRRDIVARVSRREQPVSDLARRYATSFASVRRHVAVLERSSPVVRERRGREQTVHGDVGTVPGAADLFEAYERSRRQRRRGVGELLAEYPVPGKDQAHDCDQHRQGR